MPAPKNKRLTITTATQEDAKDIEQLLRESPYNSALITLVDHADRFELGTYWQKAVRDGDIVGCIQVVFALPVARMEYLCVDEQLEPFVRAKIVRALLTHSEVALAASGAQAVAGVVPFHLKGYKRQLKKLGGVATEQGNVMVKRLGQ